MVLPACLAAELILVDFIYEVCHVIKITMAESFPTWQYYHSKRCVLV